MKTQINKFISIKKNAMSKTKITIAAVLLATGLFAQNQSKPVAAVLGIDSKGVISESEAVGYMVRLEMEKLNLYNIMDKYDVAEAVHKNEIDVKTCFGKSCVVAAGKALHVDKMITGSIERFGEKIVISLKVIDVKTELVEKQDATEYLNLQTELQKMIAISVQKLMGVTPDQNNMNLLINYDVPIENPKTKLNLSGPRMGGSMSFGDAAKVLTAPESKGGYNMYPIMFDFGWQKEWQYLSAGNFQALVEFVPMISGLESGRVIPSLTILNGFRVGKGGWEFAFGPSFRVVNKEYGFFGTGEYGTTKGEWYTNDQWNTIASADSSAPVKNPMTQTQRLDSRGAATLSTSLVLAVGRTFKSGYLNIPVNVFISPRKEGTNVGFSFGFNIQKKKRVE